MITAQGFDSSTSPVIFESKISDYLRVQLQQGASSSANVKSAASPAAAGRGAQNMRCLREAEGAEERRAERRKEVLVS